MELELADQVFKLARQLWAVSWAIASAPKAPLPMREASLQVYEVADRLSGRIREMSVAEQLQCLAALDQQLATCHAAADAVGIVFPAIAVEDLEVTRVETGGPLEPKPEPPATAPASPPPALVRPTADDALVLIDQLSPAERAEFEAIMEAGRLARIRRGQQRRVWDRNWATHLWLSAHPMPMATPKDAARVLRAIKQDVGTTPEQLALFLKRSLPAGVAVTDLRFSAPEFVSARQLWLSWRAFVQDWREYEALIEHFPPGSPPREEVPCDDESSEDEDRFPTTGTNHEQR